MPDRCRDRVWGQSMTPFTAHNATYIHLSSTLAVSVIRHGRLSNAELTCSPDAEVFVCAHDKSD